MPFIKLLLYIFLFLTSLIYAEKEFVNACFNQDCFTLEIADTYKQRKQGLMYVNNMHKKNGMLFSWKTEKNRSMWMKNTYIPLDILWLNKELQIVHIHSNARILDLTPLTSPSPAQYVIELNAGISSENRILVGDTVSINYLSVQQ